MKERPILFSGEMVLACLRNTKTQTRRVVMPQPQESYSIDYNLDHTIRERRSYGWTWQYNHNAMHLPTGSPQMLQVCPYGAVGDRLWVRETWASPDPAHPRVRVAYRADMTSYGNADSTHMITGETIPDAKMFPSPVYPGQIARWRPSIFMPRWASRLTLRITAKRVERVQDITEVDALAEGVDSVAEYRELWDRLNAKRGYGWEANPWVWALTFERVA